MKSKRIVIGISGASGTIYGVRLLQVLRDIENIEMHLVLTAAAKRTLLIETEYSLAEAEAFADVVHASSNMAASISSGLSERLG